MNIWKVSHGNNWFTPVDNNDLFSRHCVCVHPDTLGKGRSAITQGQNFENVPSGDFFYLCYSNDCIRLFGRFTGKSHYSQLPDKEDWLEQEYELLFESIRTGGYDGDKYWWTPNDNSTFIKVSDNQIFQELILVPFFNKTLNDLIVEDTKEPNTMAFKKSRESSISAEILKVDDLLKVNNLNIPIYQRPYKWLQTNVRQLLDDILTNKIAGKKNYRIGSVILHDNDSENTLDIVDGQQRITTLCLLQKACSDNETSRLNAIEKLKYNHIDSTYNIKNNFLYIKAWLDENCYNSRNDYWDYVCSSCEFVKITVTDLSEAFQMFDSQNGRGKELEAYNLLKAFHIRAMEQESRDEKIRCDQRWEAATQYDATPKIENDPNIDILQQLFSEQLYRSRIWSKNKTALAFSKAQISEFKGFTIDKNHPAVFPYQNPQLLQYLTSKFYKNVLAGTVATQNRFEYGDNDRIDPFVNINQQIVNGRSFFDFVETYVEIYKQLFIHIDTYQLSEFKEFYYSYCLNYGDSMENRKNDYSFLPKYPALRTGDTYLRECYKSLIFVLFDKFGEKGLLKYYKILYRLVYKERIYKSQVKYNAVAEMPGDYFKIITDAKGLADLSVLNQMMSWSLKEHDDIGKLNLDKLNVNGASISDFILNDNFRTY